ncbi:cysteine desulfurase/ selenocysteine lyase [Vigna unguiculata]|uniref:Cysteine desulfurase/ selenocysteine lyase n=1 Tax=Vigna unguiculata TaxID=3917 RepID=A0A4D6L8U3_VIGUN|nr:cysteine desulfurase/ selenocysteine lyase [Vigna unguiculata]
MWIGYWPQEMHLEMILTYSCLRKPRRIAKSEKRKDAQVSDSSREETRFHHEWGKHSESESESESSFQKVVEMGVPCNECVEEKLRWLRSQIIGNSAEFDSPFGRRIVVYADHTASARSLRYNENFIADHLLPFYGNTHTCDSYVGSRTTKMVEEARKYIKRCLGGGKDDALIFCGSGSTAAMKRLQEVMGITVPSILRERVLKSLSTEERWVVFVGPHEHHSNLLSWRQSLAEVVEIGLDHQGLINMDALKLKLEFYKDTNRPMLGSFSACSNVTGIHSDTRAIAHLLHQYKAFACFDFAASGPYVEIKMRCGESDGYDAVFLSPHKFLGGPDSPGILLMNDALYRLRSSPPSTCGGGTVDYVNGFNEKDTVYLENIEERENGGTPPIIQTVRAALAFWVKEYISYKEIEKREQLYIKKALKRLMSNPNIEVLGNLSTKRQAILSFIIYSTTNKTSLSPGWGIKWLQEKQEKQREEVNFWKETESERGKLLHGPFVATLLSDLFGIQARGGCACAGPYGHQLLGINKAQSLAIRSAIQQGYVGVKPGWSRVSFPYYMEEEEFEFILTAIEFVANYGQRFLPLYSFNLRNGSWRMKKEQLQALINQNNCNFRKTLDEADDLKAVKAGVGYNVGTKQVSVLRKSYLDMAKYIATLLPRFPSQAILHEDVDPNVLYFRL